MQHFDTQSTKAINPMQHFDTQTCNILILKHATF